MDSSEGIAKTILNDWIDEETRHLDLVASWETLCDAYRTLEFADPIGDATRMEEFKWIIAEMNKHLSRARTKLLSCKTSEAVRETLENMYTPSGKTSIAGRKDLAYHKLRQMWVTRMLMQLQTMTEQMNEENGAYHGEPEW